MPASLQRKENLSEALRRTAAGVGTPLVVAGAATAAGFLSLFPPNTAACRTWV